MNNPEQQSRWNRRRLLMMGAVVLVLAAVSAGILYAQGRGGNSPRISANAEHQMVSRAQQVMPFDLNGTTHTFTKTNTGGLEKVVVNNSSDSKNISLIRSHLSMVAAMFQQGNYSDPATIHGMDMPGLKELESNASQTKIVYSDIPGGGRISYSSTVPSLISAIHAYFDRQNADHSMPGMGG